MLSFESGITCPDESLLSSKKIPLPSRSADSPYTRTPACRPPPPYGRTGVAEREHQVRIPAHRHVHVERHREQDHLPRPVQAPHVSNRTLLAQVPRRQAYRDPRHVLSLGRRGQSNQPQAAKDSECRRLIPAGRQDPSPCPARHNCPSCTPGQGVWIYPLCSLVKQPPPFAKFAKTHQRQRKPSS